MIFKTCLLLFFSTALFSKELVVVVPTQKKLQAAYVSGIHGKKPAFDNRYLKQLGEVLRYDFNHNGRTSVVPLSDHAEKIFADEQYQKAFYPKLLQDLHVSYAIQARIEDRELHISCYVASASVIKHFKPLKLSGHLCDDRRLIHRLSDGIFFDLFKAKGIASTQIMYAYQPTWTSEKSEIWQCDYDGANAHPITHENVQSVTPHPFAADRFVYACYKSGQTKIYVKKCNEAHGEPCIQLSGSQFHPKLNQALDVLAFTSDHLGRNDLYLQPLKEGQPDGRPVQLYAFPRSVTASPTFSPDGNRMAFVSDQSGNPKIYLIDIPDIKTLKKRPDARLLTSKHNACVCPSWSPDGQKIAYSAKVDGVRQIWVYDLKTQKTTQLTSGTHHKENPSWAHNSQHIIYNTTDGDIYDLYRVYINHPIPVRITDGKGVKHYPSWTS